MAFQLDLGGLFKLTMSWNAENKPAGIKSPICDPKKTKADHNHVASSRLEQSCGTVR